MRLRSTFRQRLLSSFPLLLALVGSSLSSRPAPADEGFRPKPLSEAERAAVGMAVDYLRDGPGTWWALLSSDAPLRALGEEAAVAEIAVRGGPPAGARWMLRTPGLRFDASTAIFEIELPSGVDETLRLDLVDEDGWKIRELRSLADPEPSPVLAAAGSPSPTSSGPLVKVVLAVAAVASVLALLLTVARPAAGGAVPGRRLRFGRRAVPVAGLATALLVLACQGTPSATTRESAASVDKPTLGTLLELREKLSGATEAARRGQFRARGEDGLIDRVGQLWEAQYLLGQDDLNQAEDILRRFDSGPALPLQTLIEARLALRRGRQEAHELYLDLIDQGLDYDGLRLELVETLALLGRDVELDFAVTELGAGGSRDAMVFYLLSQLAVTNDDWDRAETYLRLAWEMEPVLRERIFSDPLLAAVAARPSSYWMFHFDSAAEPVVEIAEDERIPFAFPYEAELHVLGRLLAVHLGDRRLLVPGGGVLAPAGHAEDAETWNRRESEEALAQLDQLRGLSGALLQPQRRRQIVAASLALAEDHRWEDLERLTATLPESLDQVPTVLVKLRALALQKVDRDVEARRLLIRLAQDDGTNRRRDPGTFYQLGEILAAQEQYDLAIRLIRRANTLSALPSSEARIQQLEMEKKLVSSYAEYQSEHFDLRYPVTTDSRYSRHLALVLEAEYERLQRWIPLRSSERVKVDLFPLAEFMASYSQGVEVLGIYDGRVRVPFADLESLHPLLVAILSHELAHAMITEKTADQSPKWLHEGLAQHVEMGQAGINPVPDLRKVARLLAFPLIDSVLQGFSEAQLVDLAYSEAAWIVHFIEAKFGVGGIHRLLDAFAAGLDTDKALRRALGLSSAELESAAWNWCETAAPTTWPSEVRRYDHEINPYIDRGSLTPLAPSAPSRNPQPPPPKVDRGQLLRDWHAGVYTPGVREVKIALAPVVRAFRGPVSQRPANVPALCRELRQRLTPILAPDSKVLAAPDGNLQRVLTAAFASFYELTKACEQGRDAQVRAELDRAEKGLASAGRYLQPHGLRP